MQKRQVSKGERRGGGGREILTLGVNVILLILCFGGIVELLLVAGERGRFSKISF